MKVFSKYSNIVGKFVWDVIAGFFIKMSLTEFGNKRLSLTNLALLIIMVKIAVSPFDWSGAALLVPVIGSYMHKRTECNKIAKLDKDKLPDAESFKKELSALRNVVVEQAKSLESQGKIMEEAKSVMTAQKISASQKRTQL